MALDPRRLLIFREVARQGSFGAAARTLGWTQPAVSQHLTRLEREAGGPLLLRGPRGVTLTEAGQMLLRRADAVAAELYDGAEEVAALHDLRRGRVRLASFPSAAATLVPAALEALAARKPDVEVGLDELEPPEAMAAVVSGDVDLAVIFGHGGPPPGLSGLAWRPLLEEDIHLVVPTGTDPATELGDLADADWIGGCVRCRDHLLTCCAKAGFVPALRHTTDDYVVVQALVSRGLGVTLLPASALTAYRHPGVDVLSPAGLGTRSIGLAHRAGADQVPAVAALVREFLGAAGAAPDAQPKVALS